MAAHVVFEMLRRGAITTNRAEGGVLRRCFGVIALFRKPSYISAVAQLLWKMAGMNVAELLDSSMGVIHRSASVR